MATYTDKVIFDSGGHTGNTYYFRIVNDHNGAPWDAVNNQEDAAASWANTAISMPEVGTTGVYKIDFPDDVDAGLYRVVIYQQSGSVPQNTDDVEETYRKQVGSIFGF